MNTLADYVRTRERFSRSANVERDHGTDAIEGYIPTGRAIDVMARIARGLSNPAAGRAFSITGPHGGGKSSLAVFLDGLLAAEKSPEFASSHAILRGVDPATDKALLSGIRSVSNRKQGFLRASATAHAEPVSATIARALHAGAVRHLGESQQIVPASFASNETTPDSGAIKDTIRRICADSPLLIVIDEFGKNLEAYAASGEQGDPFLLQELAEMTQGEGALPFVLITMQHLSFDEYVQQHSAARRREWSKVQGRFQDIPFVETPAQARRLIALTFERSSAEFDTAADRRFESHTRTIETLGLRELADDAARSLPLHPVCLAVLPDLCSRYGQNERTLFSFLAGPEPLAVPMLLGKTKWTPNRELPLFGLDKLYDYFLESSGSMIGVADSASRWIEIETRIRDTAGLSSAELRAVKTIGVLNLVSSGGRVRASRTMLEFALATGERGTTNTADIERILESLIDAGLVVYRAFSDEYRIWQGSDYDLRRVIDNARRDCEGIDLAALLNEVVPLDPAVAGRHSQRNGILRYFERRFSNLSDTSDIPADCDGLVLYSTAPTGDVSAIEVTDDRPVVIVTPKNIAAVHEAAIDAASLLSALRSAETEDADWVARRELVERASAAQQQLAIQVGHAWDYHSTWQLVGSEAVLNPARGLSFALSEVADLAYTSTPRIANEMVARRDLTSQGAKARRILIDAMLEHRRTEAFAITGYGPEKAMYEALFRSTGMHAPTEDGHWDLHAPTDARWKHVWDFIGETFTSAADSRLNLREVIVQLTSPPFGMKEGVLPIVLIANLLASEDEIALYEHGSLVITLDDAVAERLLKNPGHFAVKNAGTRRGARKAVIDALVARLAIQSRSGAEPTFLNVATALFRELRLLPPYTQKVKRSISAEARAVREAFHTASEPDVLIFDALPEVLGSRAFSPTGRADKDRAQQFANQLADAIVELRGAYPDLLSSVEQRLAESTATRGESLELREQLQAQARSLEGRVLEPRLKAFVGALSRPLDGQAWIENVAMVVMEGQSPRTWTDEHASRFPLLVRELGGAFRRTLALLYDHLAADTPEGSFMSSRMTLTQADGSETIELLTLTDTERNAIDHEFEPLIEKLAELWGSRTAACRMLMARLAAEHTTTDHTNSAVEMRKDVGHG